MKNIKTYQVYPNIPAELSFLEELAQNMWWCWEREAIELFRRIDPKLWAASGRNPIAFFTIIPQKRFEQLAKDDGYLSHLERVKTLFQNRGGDTQEKKDGESPGADTIAYFSMEFGLHESLPLFAGGLGILAGDHLKASSNMTLPLVGIGLMYRHGYFRQYLNPDGWQQEEYPETDIYSLPVQRVYDVNGNEIRIRLSGPEGTINAMVWKIDVGRVPLFLLDTNMLENSPQCREITSRLYAGDSKIRLAQEMLLGIGGMRALRAMGILPKVVHMNEGHCAFAGIERLIQIMEDYHIDLDTACEIIPRTTVFTTHTPVAAGHDDFPVDMVKPYFKPLAEKLGISEKQMIAWGQPPGADENAPLSMFILGQYLAQYSNGVSRLHGEIARRMWASLWPERPVNEVPISHVTNGIHVSTFISQEFAFLFDRYLGPDWHLSSRKPDNIKRIEAIYDEELWRAHEMNRARLTRTCREQLVKQYARRNAPRSVLENVERVLDPDILTVAFARRFATYKRAYLLLQDFERLEAIINSKERPVQFIFAGKAHPRDNEGKDLIKQLFQVANKPEVRHRIIFLEDYDMHLARHLLQGADVWLNTPRRPLEACGTSGMKAAANGVLNVSILDGWWCEGYSEDRGWKIGNGEEYEDNSYQDAVESQALYNVLENEVVPCFYDRKNGDLPSKWLQKMKASMKMAMESFCSLRMVTDYDNNYYLPAAENFDQLTADDAAAAKNYARQIKRIRSRWSQITIGSPVRNFHKPSRVGDQFEVTAEVHLGELGPEEVDIELCYGRLKSVDEIAASSIVTMAVAEDYGNGHFLYNCKLNCESSGRFGFSVRATPHGDDWLKLTPGLITWATE